jgi:hypothetical protein
MTAQELRIGNTVLFLGKEVVVEGIDNLEGRSTMYWIKPAGMIPSKIIHFKGAYITEEWLLEKGFEKLTDRNRNFTCTSFTYKKGVSFIVNFDDGILSVDFWIGSSKRYKHELQNLFFALTGKEL